MLPPVIKRYAWLETIKRWQLNRFVLLDWSDHIPRAIAKYRGTKWS